MILSRVEIYRTNQSLITFSIPCMIEQINGLLQKTEWQGQIMVDKNQTVIYPPASLSYDYASQLQLQRVPDYSTFNVQESVKNHATYVEEEKRLPYKYNTTNVQSSNIPTYSKKTSSQPSSSMTMYTKKNNNNGPSTNENSVKQKTQKQTNTKTHSKNNSSLNFLELDPVTMVAK